MGLRFASLTCRLLRYVNVAVSQTATSADITGAPIWMNSNNVDCEPVSFVAGAADCELASFVAVVALVGCGDGCAQAETLRTMRVSRRRCIVVVLRTSGPRADKGVPIRHSPSEITIRTVPFAGKGPQRA